MKILRSLISAWSLLYGLALAAIIFYTVMGLWGEPSADADTIIYTQVILRAMGIWFVLFLVILLGAAVWLHYKKHHNADRSAALFGVSLIPILITTYLAVLAIGDPRLFHLESVKFQKHVYHLAQRGSGLVLYECDEIGVVCHAIYSESAIILFLNCQEKCNEPPRLIVDTQVVSLIVHTPPP